MNIETKSRESSPFLKVIEELEIPRPYATVSDNLFNALGDQLVLPDDGESVTRIASQAPGGAFDPRQLEKLPVEKLGYAAKWVVLRYQYYGLDWDITGLRLESLNAQAKELPWVVIINGGSANVYEFFIDPLNRPGLGQYLAQRANVLIVTIPGNFKYGGWTLPPAQRAPQYLLDRDSPAEETKLRNAIYTNRMIMEGLKRLIAEETSGDILIVGHSTSGELAFLSISEPDLGDRLKGRFLGWASGGPSTLRRQWEERAEPKKIDPVLRAKYPPLTELRIRNASEYVTDGYVGPLNPCRDSSMGDEAVAARWLSLVDRNRPNIKQVLQDLEHRGLAELRPLLEDEIEQALKGTRSPVALKDVSNDLFAANNAAASGYRRMVWVVGRWDKKHWHKTTPEEAQELTIANQFRARNPEAAIRVLLFDLPLTHYGHIEKPREVAAGLLGAVYWLIRS